MGGALVLRFALNTRTIATRAPDVEVQGASDFTMPGVFSESFKPNEIESLQTLRGMVTHCLSASLFWRTSFQPIEAPLYHSDETGTG